MPSPRDEDVGKMTQKWIYIILFLCYISIIHICSQKKEHMVVFAGKAHPFCLKQIQ